MNRLMKLGQAAELIHKKAENYWDEVFPASVINFHDFDSVDIDGRTYRLMDSAKRLTALRLGIPHEYLKKCPPHIQEANLNYWIRTLGHARLFLRFDGMELRAMFTTRYKAINNVEIMERMLQNGFSEEEDVYLTLSNEILVMNMPDHQRTFGLFGDQITPGVSISNSEVGVAAFGIQAFFLRLACTNGLVTSERMENKIRHIRENALEEFHVMLGQVSLMTQRSREKMRLSVHQQVEDPVLSIESFGRRFGIAKRELEIVKEAWEREPQMNMWGVIDAFTAAAQSKELSPETSYRLQQVGGLILNLVKK